MDIQLSYNWLRQYLKTDLKPADLARELSLHGPSVERQHSVKLDFEKVFVAEITELKPHPNADKLRLATVNIGKQTLEIVCGAPNIATGQKVPLVMVGGRVGEMTITKSAIRGVESNGMLCSPKELGLGADHSGVLIIPSTAKVGASLSDLLEMNDTILDVEVTGNRTDTMGVIGLAREASAITGDKFLEPKPKLPKASRKQLPLSAKIESKNCRRYQAIAMTGVTVGPSPLWLQQRLITAGLRPINNIVDVTNYLALEYNQPLHAFDYEKIGGAKLIIRQAKANETLEALDGVTYKLGADAMVVADKDKALLIAGIIGGPESGVIDQTTSIVLEAANFDPLAVRKTARKHNVHTDSSSRFEKNLHPQSTTPAIIRACELIHEFTGAEVASKLIDLGEKNYKATKIKLNPERVTRAIGTTIAVSVIKKNLTKLGFEVAGTSALTVTVPWYRSFDVREEHDLVEEIARLYGYHNITPTLPAGIPDSYGEQQKQLAQEYAIKQTLKGAGFTETYSYSLISSDLITKANLKPEDHLEVANPLSAEFQYLRTSLLPSILTVIHDNEGYRRDLKLFELSNVYLPQTKDLPTEQQRLIIAISNDNAQPLVTELRQTLESITFGLHCAALTVIPTSLEEGNIVIGNEEIGTIKLISNQLRQQFGLKTNIAIADLNVAALLAQAKPNPTIQSVPRFPGITLDLSLELNRDITWFQLQKTLANSNQLARAFELMNVYYGKQLAADKKVVTIRLTYRDDERTLELAEAQKIHTEIAERLQKEYTAVIR